MSETVNVRTSEASDKEPKELQAKAALLQAPVEQLIFAVHGTDTLDSPELESIKTNPALPSTI